MEWQRFHNILRMLNWLVLLCFSLASYFSMGPFWTTGVLLGGLIAIANFNVLQRTVRRAFSPEGIHQGARFSIVGKSCLRLLALGLRGLGPGERVALVLEPAGHRGLRAGPAGLRMARAAR